MAAATRVNYTVDGRSTLDGGRQIEGERRTVDIWRKGERTTHWYEFYFILTKKLKCLICGKIWWIHLINWLRSSERYRTFPAKKAENIGPHCKATRQTTLFLSLTCDLTIGPSPIRPIIINVLITGWKLFFWPPFLIAYQVPKLTKLPRAFRNPQSKYKTFQNTQSEIEFFFF
jgi:hypothetical protein